MIVDQAVYVDGRRHEVGDVSDSLAAVRSSGDGGFLWVGMVDPTEAELDEILDELDLHPMALEDLKTGDQRPKVERFDNGLLVVLKTLRWVAPTMDIETGELLMFVAPDAVLVVRRGDADPLGDVRATLEGQPRRLARGPLAVGHAVMDRVADEYLAVEQELGEAVLALEHDVFDPSREVQSQTIYELKREVLEAKRAVDPFLPFLSRLTADGSDVPADILPFLRDVEDHITQVDSRLSSYDVALSDVMNVRSNQIALQQNEDMRKISAWVAMAVVPTMLAGIYGMNFDNMPELHTTWGYPVVLGFMACVSLGLYVAFKRRRWL